MKTVDFLLILATIVVSAFGVFWGIKTLKDERKRNINDFIKQRKKNEITYNHGEEN